MWINVQFPDNFLNGFQYYQGDFVDILQSDFIGNFILKFLLQLKLVNWFC